MKGPISDVLPKNVLNTSTPIGTTGSMVIGPELEEIARLVHSNLCISFTLRTGGTDKEKYFNPSIPKDEIEWLVLYAFGRSLIIKGPSAWTRRISSEDVS